MPFLYGNHVVKAHLGRITEDTPEHQGVVVYSMSDVPLASFSSVAVVFSLLNAYLGLRCNCTVNGRHTQIRSNVNYSFPSSVRVFSLASSAVCNL